MGPTTIPRRRRHRPFTRSMPSISTHCWKVALPARHPPLTSPLVLMEMMVEIPLIPNRTLQEVPPLSTRWTLCFRANAGMKRSEPQMLRPSSQITPLAQKPPTHGTTCSAMRDPKPPPLVKARRTSPATPWNLKQRAHDPVASLRTHQDTSPWQPKTLCQYAPQPHPTLTSKIVTR